MEKLFITNGKISCPHCDGPALFDKQFGTMRCIFCGTDFNFITAASKVKNLKPV